MCWEIFYGACPAAQRTILLGSHIDTVRDGGRYDGAAGVMTALAVLRDLKAAGYEPEYNLEIVGLVEEEGSRFASSPARGAAPSAVRSGRKTFGEGFRRVTLRGG